MGAKYLTIEKVSTIFDYEEWTIEFHLNYDSSIDMKNKSTIFQPIFVPGRKLINENTNS